MRNKRWYTLLQDKYIRVIKMRRINRIIFGAALVILGLLFALKACNVITFDILFKGWWTLFIIVPCTVGLITDRDKTGSIIGLVVGIVLLLCARGILVWSMMWKLVIPVIAVIIGVRIMFSEFFRKRTLSGFSEKSDESRKAPSDKSIKTSFSSENINYDNRVFDGVELNSSFGSIKCDISNAIINGDCTINANVSFGGIEILVPKDVNIVITSDSAFGGVTDERPVKSTGHPFTVYINARTSFGGIEIK